MDLWCPRPVRRGRQAPVSSLDVASLIHAFLYRIMVESVCWDQANDAVRAVPLRSKYSARFQKILGFKPEPLAGGVIRLSYRCLPAPSASWALRHAPMPNRLAVKAFI